MLLVFSAAGCGHKKAKKGAKKPAVSKKALQEHQIHTEVGELTRNDDQNPQLTLWDVHWQSADLSYWGQKNVSGTAQGVTGTIYQKNRPASTYSADTATMDRASDILRLDGHVVVKSLSTNGILRCEHLVGSSKKNVIKAQGGVQIESPEYDMNGATELWTSSDLKKVSTPDMFNKL